MTEHKPRRKNGGGASNKAAPVSEESDALRAPRNEITSSPVIVGIGASAGGLEAFTAFFEHMRSDSGMAFVLVQHLAPDHKSMLAEILGKTTAMPVTEAADGGEVLPNHVFVIPPDATLTIANGRFVVVKPAPPRELRRPIDTFMFSLARDQGENAVCVILSGTGSDGSLGLGSIKEHGGLTIAQAEIDHKAKLGMPSSAAATGFVDHVLQVRDIPAKLLDYHRHLVEAKAHKNTEGIRDDAAGHLAEIATLLRAAVGHDFSEYKEKTFVRRIQRRMQVLHLDSMNGYLEELRGNPKELEFLFRDLLIGVTQFFRDPAAFDALEAKVVPALIAGKGSDDQVRVWVAGCASGEEAYSIAILLMEAVAKLPSAPGIIIFATDIDDRAIVHARAGRYPEALLDAVSPQRLERWFVREGDHYAVSSELRENIVFSVHSVLRDPPFSKLDLISCRNLLIYLDTALQDRLIPIFHYALRPGGYLFLGPSESIARQEHFFTEVDKKHRLFERRNDTPAALPSLPLSPAASRGIVISSAGIPHRHAAESGVERGARRVMERYAPAHLLVDQKHQVLSFSGQTGRYLDPQPGAASFNLFNLIQNALRPVARSLLQKAAATGLRAVQGNVAIEVAGKSDAINLIVEPVLPASGKATHYIVIFQDIETKEPAGVPDKEGRGSGNKELEAELSAIRARLQAALDEAEQANEDLKSANEEYQSLNEELQSSNEELETSKEEMQSINEELQTVNNELSEKNTSLHRLNSDLQNLLEGTDIAILFLDDALCVRTFTAACTKLFHLREADRGRPVIEIASRLSYHAIEADVRSALAALSVVEREVHTPDNGATFLMRIRPYRTLNGVVDGVVITFVDISEQKRHQETLARLAAIVESSDDAIIGHSLDGVISSWNRGAEKIFGYTAEEIVGKPLSVLVAAAGGKDQLPGVLERVKLGEAVQSYETLLAAKVGRRIHISLTVSPVRNADGTIIAASIVARDVSERVRSERQRDLLMKELDHRTKNTLSTVLAISRETARHVTTLPEFGAAFQARILALSKTHNLLTESHWEGASLRRIFAAELSPYDRAGDEPRFALDGETVNLTPAQALMLGMAVHELTTNAAKYGALSTQSGRVDVTWSVDRSGAEEVARIRWVESGGPPVTPPTRSGFGSHLIERGLSFETGGEVRLEFAPTGLLCVIAMPLKRTDNDGERTANGALPANREGEA
ncbi:PAS domain S-box protein [Rhodomicrobium sp. Az07]|uniref:CheR family methyltransferase n=1 Tax=Rhodomicrobium sp. Az07 TaxID=2839034 RepID=UPI001BECC4FE|nr:chemotaxis protein CheB [Rhodomicrobium sp. Az07]MBT3071918.1 PAS domain S-box protein [Rhodomicrobium sp. Az07]